MSLDLLKPYVAQLGIELSSQQWDQLRKYMRLVLEHNEKTNLTAAKTPEEIAERHFADALAALPLLKRLMAGSAEPQIVDVGTGGGFIGICLQIAWPESRVTLLEAVNRKFLFLNMACIELNLRARPRWISARKGVPATETLFDAAIERALAPLDEALALCVPLVKPGGPFIAYQSDPVLPPKAQDAAAKFGALLSETVSYRLPNEPKDRYFTVFKKS